MSAKTIAKAITKTNAQWNKILNQLANCGPARHELYGDIEYVLERYSPDYEGTITIRIIASDDAWRELNSLED